MKWLKFLTKEVKRESDNLTTYFIILVEYIEVVF